MKAFVFSLFAVLFAVTGAYALTDNLDTRGNQPSANNWRLTQDNFNDTKNVEMQFKFSDVSTADSEHHVAVYACKITAARTVLMDQISGANATIKIYIDGTEVGENGNKRITVAQASSAPGDKDSVTGITSNNVVAAGAYVTMETDGGSTGTAEFFGTVLCER